VPHICHPSADVGFHGDVRIHEVWVERGHSCPRPLTPPFIQKSKFRNQK
jgi:hypothetical protein